MDVVQGGNHNRVPGQLVATGQDHVHLGRAARLVRGVVAPLRLLDELVEEAELVCQVGRHLGVVVPAVVDQLLQQALLVSGIPHQAVYQPGEQRGCGGEAGSRGYEKRRDELRGRQLFAIVVCCSKQVICHDVLATVFMKRLSTCLPTTFSASRAAS